MDVLDYLIFIRRKLHKIPELHNSEFLTQKFITEELKKLNIKFRTVKTAVIAEIKGRNQSVMLAFRADMDALPITESGDKDYKSINSGIMHACGHDGHMAMLMAVAKYYSEQIPEVNLRLIFQPAEECEGGAEMLIENNVLKDVNAIFGLHLSPEIKIGTIATDSGAIFAGACDFNITFEGKSGHCADSQKYIDALRAGNEFYTRAYALYNEKYKANSIFHIGKITGGLASNIVADHAQYCCTFRFFDESIEEDFMMRIEKILIDIKANIGAEHRLIVEYFYPPLINPPHIINMLKNKFLITSVAPKYTAEDFAYYLKKIDGAFAWLGTKDEHHFAPLHNPEFDFDERALITGVNYYIKLAENILIQN